jgi:serine/threonine protein kinase
MDQLDNHSDTLYKFYSSYVISHEKPETIKLGCDQLFSLLDLGPEAKLQSQKIFITLKGKIIQPEFTNMLYETKTDFNLCKYQYIKEIDQGASTEVGTYCLGDKIVALKIQNLFSAIKEISHLKYIGSHPFIANIIKFEIGVQDIYGMIDNDVGIVNQEEVIYIFMPLYKSLYKEIYGDNDRFEITESHSLLTEVRKKKYMRQILVALDYIHSKNVIHMDIKPENILLDDYDNIKLIDFDTSVIGVSKTLRKITGTESHLPIEFISKNYAEFSVEVDVYTAGLTFIEIITGVYARNSDNCGIYKELINWMLSEPNSRPSIINCTNVLDSLHYYH